jgi:hypothetical protein
VRKYGEQARKGFRSSSKLRKAGTPTLVIRGLNHQPGPVPRKPGRSGRPLPNLRKGLGHAPVRYRAIIVRVSLMNSQWYNWASTSSRSEQYKIVRVSPCNRSPRFVVEDREMPTDFTFDEERSAGENVARFISFIESQYPSLAPILTKRIQKILPLASDPSKRSTDRSSFNREVKEMLDALCQTGEAKL